MRSTENRDPMPTPNSPQASRLPSASSNDPYCGNCGYSFRGLQESSKCPECGKPIVEVLMRRGFPLRPGRRYRSAATLFGLPVLDIAVGPSRNEMRGKARGIIAIGDFACGGVAIGGLATGIVAIGGLAFGVFSLGGLSIGLLAALGGLAASPGIANGGLAISAVACGGMAIGIIAQGGVALGIFARGGLACGNSSTAAFDHLRWLLGAFPPRALDVYRPLFFTVAPAIFLVALTGILAIIRATHFHEPAKPGGSGSSTGARTK